MKRLGFVALTTLAAIADTGTAVKSNPADYQAHESVRGAVIAATVLTAEQVSKTFSGAVSKNFVVVDVAVYPDSGRTFDVASIDFSLNTSLSAGASEVAWHGKKPPNADPRFPSSSPVNVTVVAGIGVASGTNPVTGQRQHTVGTYEGVVVDNYPRPTPPPTSSSADQTYVLEGKLRGYELQDGPTSMPISGYLYFPLDKKRKGDAPVLGYSRSGDRAKLTLR